MNRGTIVISVFIPGVSPQRMYADWVENQSLWVGVTLKPKVFFSVTSFLNELVQGKLLRHIFTGSL